MTKYSKEELFQCIYDCATEELPDGWLSVYVHAKVDSTGTKAEFYYLTEKSTTKEKFTPKNFIAPMNAVIELQALDAQNNRYWDEVDIDISSSGEMKMIQR